MTKRLSSKKKISRRLGVNLWGEPKDPSNKRPYGPGEHGPVKRVKKTDYGKQLHAKQRLKGYYGNVSEKKFRSYYDEAARMKGDTAQNLIGQLECRLDTFIYRAKFVPTVFAARQFVNHGHLLINGKRINIPSYQLKEGDVVKIREKSLKIPAIQTSLALPTREVPEYISSDVKKMEATLIRVPTFEEVPYPVNMEPNLIVEFYSRQ